MLKLFSFASRVSHANCRNPRNTRRHRSVESLEDRVVMDAALAAAPDLLLSQASPAAGVTSAYVSGLNSYTATSNAFGAYTSTAVGRLNYVDLALWAVDPIPAYNSNPGAAKTLFLDFNGNFESRWESDGFTFNNVTTARFDMDGSSRTLSDQERQVIKQIWQQVAEDYAPFNINVTTVDPGGWANADNRQVKVAIGGRQADMIVAADSQNPQSEWNGNSGYAAFGFDNAASNTVYVFSRLIQDWGVSNSYFSTNYAAVLGNTASHEAGHNFGLHHIAQLNADGTVNDWYDPGTAERTPIMGSNTQNDRLTWTVGPIGPRVNGVTPMQDDVAILRQKIGLRFDDHGNTKETATPLYPANNASILSSMSATGIIGTRTDFDVFSFQVSAGKYDINVNVAEVGANLDSRLFLYKPNAQGLLEIIGTSAPGTSLKAFMTKTLATGTYYVAVAGQGRAGDLGQYRLSIGRVLEVFVDDSYYTQIHVLPNTLLTAQLAIVNPAPLAAQSVTTSSMTSLSSTALRSVSARRFSAGTGFVESAANNMATASLKLDPAKGTLANRNARDSVFAAWDAAF